MNMILCKNEISVNVNHGWMWIMGEYILCVNMNYMWICIMGKHEVWVNINYEWIWIKGEYEYGGPDTHSDSFTDTSIPWLSLA